MELNESCDSIGKVQPSYVMSESNGSITIKIEF